MGLLALEGLEVLVVTEDGEGGGVINRESTTLLEEDSGTAYVNGMPAMRTLQKNIMRDLPKSSTQAKEIMEMMALKDLVDMLDPADIQESAELTECRGPMVRLQQFDQ